MPDYGFGVGGRVPVYATLVHGQNGIERLLVQIAQVNRVAAGLQGLDDAVAQRGRIAVFERVSKYDQDAHELWRRALLDRERSRQQLDSRESGQRRRQPPTRRRSSNRTHRSRSLELREHALDGALAGP